VEHRFLKVEHDLDQLADRSRRWLIDPEGLEDVAKRGWDLWPTSEVQILQLVQHGVQAVQVQTRRIVAPAVGMSFHPVNPSRLTRSSRIRQVEPSTKACTRTRLSVAARLGTCLARQDLATHAGTASGILTLLPMDDGAAARTAHDLCPGVGR